MTGNDVHDDGPPAGDTPGGPAVHPIAGAPVPGRGPDLVLVGLPGAGKSAVGRHLARLLGTTVSDSDDLVEKRAGRSVSDVFAAAGEGSFRELERDVIAAQLADGTGILTLGGGAVLDPATRADLADRRVVHLAVSPEQAHARVGSASSRPLLAEDPVGRLAALAEERAPLYAEVATWTVDTDGRDLSDVAAEVAALAAAPTVLTVPGARPYPVTIGHDLSGEVARAIPETARRVLLVHPEVMADRAGRIAAALRFGGREAHTFLLPDAEAAKTWEVVGRCHTVLGEHGFGRQDVVVTLGGGATTDVGGFVAATWLRGVGVVHVPTTLLGMVDAAVGGKTGINTPAGKNLVGSFHAPLAVVCDLDLLATLPAADLAAGLAEVVKIGFVSDRHILSLVRSHPEEALDPGSAVLRELVERAVAVKAHVVGEDLREAGLREVLNYGHTTGHGIERASGYSWRHGDAVAVGSVVAAELAERSGLAESGLADGHRAVLTSLGLPVTVSGLDWGGVRAAMGNDKKVRGDRLRFVALRAEGEPVILDGPDDDVLEAAWATVSA
ncbi:3-dehydroquinate synthase [Georgenia sp. Z1344]|uniref:3-dehydroquinate synthase n=1 Tax=Georgenia sp. Z1344 TaxID=3416706 RepID=UPI003CE7858C